MFSMCMTVLLLQNALSTAATLQERRYTQFPDTRWVGLVTTASRSLIDCARLCAVGRRTCAAFNWSWSLGACELVTCPQVMVASSADVGWVLYVADTHLTRYNAWAHGAPSACSTVDTYVVQHLAAGPATIPCSGTELSVNFPDAEQCVGFVCQYSLGGSAGFITFNPNTKDCSWRTCAVGDSLEPEVDMSRDVADVLYLHVFCV